MQSPRVELSYSLPFWLLLEEQVVSSANSFLRSTGRWQPSLLLLLHLCPTRVGSLKKLGSCSAAQGLRELVYGMRYFGLLIEDRFFFLLLQLGGSGHPFGLGLSFFGLFSGNSPLSFPSYFTVMGPGPSFPPRHAYLEHLAWLKERVVYCFLENSSQGRLL